MPKQKKQKKQNFEKNFRILLHGHFSNHAPSDTFPVSYALKGAGITSLEICKQIAKKSGTFENFENHLRNHSQNGLKKDTRPYGTKKGQHALWLFMTDVLKCWSVEKNEIQITIYQEIQYCGEHYIWNHETNNVYLGVVQSRRIETGEPIAMWNPEEYIDINDYTDRAIIVDSVGSWKWFY